MTLGLMVMLVLRSIFSHLLMRLSLKWSLFLKMLFFGLRRFLIFSLDNFGLKGFLSRFLSEEVFLFLFLAMERFFVEL
jgi:hypothetical protein